MVPNIGTYTSDDGLYKVTIESVDGWTGKFSGKYKATTSPKGALNIESISGSFSWVARKSDGKDGVAPFVIGFAASQRSEGRTYVVKDVWEGAYQVNDTLLLTGSRAFVDQNGIAESITLGTKQFIL